MAHSKWKKGLTAVFKRNEMWLKYSTTFRGRQRNCHTLAKNKVIDALKKKYRSRRLFKRERRRLWIMRVRANARLHGLRYSYLIMRLKEANININRKIMSQLGVYDRGVLTNIIQTAEPDWKEKKARKMQNLMPRQRSVEEIDDAMIPYIEKCVPEIYTDATIRFNRQVKKWGVEYTIDMGEPDTWRELMARMPELANFNLPDQWMGNANAQFQTMPLEYLAPPPQLESKDYLKFRKMVDDAQAEDEEKAKRGEPTWPKKEGVSREDWFAEEPQSWA